MCNLISQTNLLRSMFVIDKKKESLGMRLHTASIQCRGTYIPPSLILRLFTFLLIEQNNYGGNK